MGGRTDRGNPRIHLRLDPRVLYGLEIVARKHGLTVNQAIYAIIEGYLEKVGGVAPRPPMDRALLNRVTITRLRALLSQLEFEIDTLDMVAVREKRLEELDKSVQQLNRMAERANDVNQRMRIYQVLGFLCQIIDGLLNAQIDAITQAILEMKKRLELLEEAFPTSETT